MGSTLFLVEIQSWDWPLHVGVRPRSAVADRDPDGDLLCVETITIEGFVLEPEEHRSKLIHLRLSPLPREIIFADRDERDVGRLYKDPVERENLGFYAALFLPADTLQRVVFCLGLLWRRVHLWVDVGAEPGAVIDYGFSVDAELKP